MKKGADVNYIEQDGKTPCHISVAVGDLKTLEFLLKKKANIHLLDNKLETPI